AAFARRRAMSFAARAERLHQLAELLQSERDRIARLMVVEMGKTRRSAVAEVEKCAWACRHYAEFSARYLADEPIETGARTYIRYVPLGPVLAVMPWNFPFWQVVRFAAPALMAGNVALLKHAANVPECALELEDLFRRAGFDAGVFQTLMISS